MLRTLVKDDTYGQSNTHDHFTLTTTDTDNLLSSDEGFLNFVWKLAFKSGEEYIQIGGVHFALERVTP